MFKLTKLNSNENEDNKTMEMKIFIPVKENIKNGVGDWEHIVHVFFIN